jgi:hypothetical protein
MNRKQFLILLVLVVVLGAGSLAVYQRNSHSWHNAGDAAAGGKLMPNLALNDIAQVVIKAGTNEVDLARVNNVWAVRQRGNYPADFSRLSGLLMKLADLKVTQTEDVGPSQLGRFELLPPGPASGTATSIEFKDENGKALGSLLLGKKHIKKPAAGAPSPMGGMDDQGWPDGRYVMTDAKTVALISDPLEDVQTGPEQWLNKEFLSVEKPRSISVKFPQATNSWTLTRTNDTADWQLADAKAGEKLDSSKISSVTAPFASASFDDVAAASAPATGSNTVLTVETFDGFSYVSTIEPKQDDGYPVRFAISANFPAARVAAKDEKPDDKAKLDKDFQAQQKTLADKLAKESAYTNWVYRMPAYSVDELLKTRQQLLQEPETNSVAAATAQK